METKEKKQILTAIYIFLLMIMFLLGYNIAINLHHNTIKQAFEQKYKDCICPDIPCKIEERNKALQEQVNYTWHFTKN